MGFEKSCPLSISVQQAGGGQSGSSVQLVEEKEAAMSQTIEVCSGY